MRYSNLMGVFNTAERLAFLVSVLMFFAIQQDARATVLPSSKGTDHGFPYAINPAIPGAVVRTLNVEVKTPEDSYLTSQYRLRGLISETRQKIAFTAMQLFKMMNSIRNIPEKKSVTIESAYIAMLKNGTRNGWPATQKLHRSGSSAEGKGPSTSQVNKTKTTNRTGTRVLEMQNKNDTVRIDGAGWNQATTDKENRTLIAQQTIKLENENQTSHSVVTGNAHVKMDTSSQTSQPIMAGTERVPIENGNPTGKTVIEAQHGRKLEIGNQTVEADGSENNEMMIDKEKQTVRPGITQHNNVLQQTGLDFPQNEDVMHTSKEEGKNADSNDLEVLRSQPNGESAQISTVDDKGRPSVVSALDLPMPDQLVPVQEKNGSASMHLEAQETQKTRTSSEMESTSSTSSGRNSQMFDSPISGWEVHAPSNASLFGNNNRMVESLKTEAASTSEHKHESNNFRNVVKHENYNKDGSPYGESSFRPSNKDPIQEMEKEAPSPELKGEISPQGDISPPNLSDMDTPKPTAEAGGATEQKLFAGEAEHGMVRNKSIDTQKDFIEEAEEGSLEERVLATDVPQGEGATASGENEGPTEKSSEADEQNANGNGEAANINNSFTNATVEGSPIPKRQEHSSSESDNIVEAKYINKTTHAVSSGDNPVNASMDNTTQLSLMVYKIAKSEEILTMAAAPCREVMGWMPPVVSQLEIELPSFKFYCVDTKEPVGDMKDLKRAFGDISGGFVQALAEEVGQALPKKVDLVVSWMGMQKWGIRKSWRFVKGLRQDGAKLVLLGNNPVSSNSEGSPGTLNVRKAPLLFNEPLRIIGNVSMDDSKQLLLYSIRSLMDSH